MIITFEGMTPRIDPTVFVAPTAVIIGNVEIGPEASVWFGTVIRGDNREHPIRIGARTSVQDNAVVHVSRRGPTIVGDDVTIGHGAVIESCEIGNGCLIGMSAVVLQRARIGDQVLVAAGTVVPAGGEIPSRTLVVGTPGRVTKELGEGMLATMARGAAHYVDLSRRYLADAGPSDGGAAG